MSAITTGVSGTSSAGKRELQHSRIDARDFRGQWRNKVALTPPQVHVHYCVTKPYLSDCTRPVAAGKPGTAARAGWKKPAAVWGRSPGTPGLDAERWKAVENAGRASCSRRWRSCSSRHERCSADKINVGWIRKRWLNTETLVEYGNVGWIRKRWLNTETLVIYGNFGWIGKRWLNKCWLNMETLVQYGNVG